MQYSHKSHCVRTDTHHIYTGVTCYRSRLLRYVFCIFILTQNTNENTNTNTLYAHRQDTPHTWGHMPMADTSQVVAPLLTDRETIAF